MKLIVSHLNPDLDAITAIWLLKKFLPGWQDAEVDFVAAGKTYKDQPIDSDENIIHIDTGLGRFDHHQQNDHSCSCSKVWEFLKQTLDPNILPKDKIITVDRLVKIVDEIDHFHEVYWPDPESDRYDFIIERIFDGWKLKYPNQSQRLVEWGMDCLDGIYQIIKNKVYAQEELKKGIEINTIWGKAIALETVNDEVMKLGQKLGYKIVIRKDPRKGYLRIKSLPTNEIDLTPLYNALKAADPDATWYFHPGKNMILNGTTKNPDMKPTRLGMEEVIAIIKLINF